MRIIRGGWEFDITIIERLEQLDWELRTMGSKYDTFSSEIYKFSSAAEDALKHNHTVSSILWNYN